MLRDWTSQCDSLFPILQVRDSWFSYQIPMISRYSALNLLSCMTLDVENIHSVVHHKDPLCTVLDYARNFENAAKEGVKRTTHWAELLHQSKVMVSCAGTCHGSCGHASHATFATCSDGSTMHLTMRAKHEGLGAIVWCCSTSTIC